MTGAVEGDRIVSGCSEVWFEAVSVEGSETSCCSDCVVDCCVFWGVSISAHGRVVGKFDGSCAGGAWT